MVYFIALVMAVQDHATQKVAVVQVQTVGILVKQGLQEHGEQVALDQQEVLVVPQVPLISTHKITR
tara:strand:- start:1332 stop:1529 length:198 start_codon:yes stop_codon:yes gene_type:complete